MLSDFFALHEIGGKRVYIVDDHHKVLAAWAIERRKLTAQPYLLTIDHHSDTDEAFRSYVCLAAYEDGSVDEAAMAAALITAIDWASDQSIAEAIAKLRHDEHIHAATRSGVLAASFSIQLSDQRGYVEPHADNVYVVPHKCAIGCQKKVYDDDCAVHHALEIIDTPYLDDQLQRIAEITTSIGLPYIENLPYILDIDLDAFHSMKAANPADPSTFRRLIRGALAITIATEPEWVKEVWTDSENQPAVDQLLALVLGQIEAAMAQGA
ncbi:hypothetical protein RHDC4_01708 [Rhodocyclaceae bacterium]|nr:hypothetical protein RHDC4_01708 [Rhodocyclaceae bacterium]